MQFRRTRTAKDLTSSERLWLEQHIGKDIHDTQPIFVVYDLSLDDTREESQTAHRQQASLRSFITNMEALPSSQSEKEFTSENHDRILYGDQS